MMTLTLVSVIPGLERSEGAPESITTARRNIDSRAAAGWRYRITSKGMKRQSHDTSSKALLFKPIRESSGKCCLIKGKNMSKAVSLAFLAGGILLIVFGVMASTSFSSDISRFFTGSPTDKAIWMLVGGVAASIVGVVGLLRG